MQSTGRYAIAVFTVLSCLSCKPSPIAGAPPENDGGAAWQVGSEDAPDRFPSARGDGSGDARGSDTDAPPDAGNPFPRSTVPGLLTLPAFIDGGAVCLGRQPDDGFYQGALRYRGPQPPPVPRHFGAAAPSSRDSGAPSIAQESARAPLGAGSSSVGGGRAAAKASAKPTAPAAPRRAASGETSAPRTAPQHLRPLPYPRPPVPDRSRDGEVVYLSNDDTMSLSSAQRVIWALENGQTIPRELIRPHELLNYFSFDTASVRPHHRFSALAHLRADRSGQAELALSIAGRSFTRDTRRLANLAYVLDRSGSMQQDARMSYLKQGLLRSFDELKHGDTIHITLFDSAPCQLVENFVVGRDSMARLRELVDGIEPQGSTNLHDGLTRGYQAADAGYRADYTNRVVLITDAEANTGTTDPRLIAEVGRHFDQRRIRLSGIGVGETFNDALLDELTERGRGAYVYLGNLAEVDAVFGSRFVSLIETVASDVHFRLELPPSLRMKTFYGEEASTDKSRVQAVHYFAGTSQLFLSDLTLARGQVNPREHVQLRVEYEDPETGSPRHEDFDFPVGAILADSHNLTKARFIATFGQTLQGLSGAGSNNAPSSGVRWLASPQVSGQAHACWQSYNDARAQLDGRTADPELRKVDQLFQIFCARFGSDVPAARSPEVQRHNDFAPRPSWPSALP